MRIGINARNILPNKLEGFGHYSVEIIQRIVKNHPEHHFVLYFDRKVELPFEQTKNVEIIQVFPPTRHPLLWILWFEFALPKRFKKDKIDAFWSPDGYLSLRSSIPQIATIHDINFEHYPADMPKLVSNYFRYFFPKFSRKAKHIITVSEYSKNDLVKTYLLPESKITAIHNGVNEIYKPLNEDEQARIKFQITNGRSYILFVGSLHPRKNVQRLITAFDRISGEFPLIDLVIVGSAMWKDKFLQIPTKLESRLHFTGHLPLTELAKVMGAADVFAFVPYFEGFGIPLVEAMKCGVPILSAKTTSLPEVAHDAAIYCNPFSVDDITNSLRLLLQNPDLRREISQKGIQRSQHFSWDKSADLVWQVLERQFSENN